MSKAWRILSAAQVSALSGQLGVYQIADGDGEVLFIGMAGGRSLFGLRGELGREQRDRDGGDDGRFQFRVEVNMSYLTRYQELLMVHEADHGALPLENRGRLSVRLGRLSPG